MSRKMVKLGGILGVGRRNGVEYFGYILEKANAGSRLGRSSKKEEPGAQHLAALIKPAYPKAGKRQHTEREYFPISEKDQAERDQHSRAEILARFAKNKEVQRLLYEKKLALDPDSKPGLPPAPYFEAPAQLNPITGPAPQAKTQAKNSGFAPIYDPVTAPPRGPEYASVNYDLITGPPPQSVERQTYSNDTEPKRPDRSQALQRQNGPAEPPIEPMIPQKKAGKDTEKRYRILVPANKDTQTKAPLPTARPIRGMIWPIETTSTPSCAA